MASLARSKEPQARYYHAAAASHRHMLVWGGYSGKGRIETSYVAKFDVLSAAWMRPSYLSGVSLPDGLQGMAVGWDEKNAYTFGGSTTLGTSINDLYAIDLASLECKKIVPVAGTPSPSAKSDCAMVYVNTKVIIHGGFTDDGQTSSELQVFDLETSK